MRKENKQSENRNCEECKRTKKTKIKEGRAPS